MVEEDLISQISKSYLEKSGKEATEVEIAEWLKSIRQLNEEGEFEGEDR